MSNYLFIQSSVRADNSASGNLAAQFSNRVRAAGHSIVIRDVGAQPLGYLDQELLAALFTPADVRSPGQALKTALVDELIAEVFAADTLVISAGMYNFGMPAQLKSWFDHVLQAQRTFRYTQDGPEGLVKGKKAVLLVASGGVYSESPADFLVPHIKQMLAFIGITDVEVVRAEGLALGNEAAQAGTAVAAAEVDALPLN